MSEPIQIRPGEPTRGHHEELPDRSSLPLALESQRLLREARLEATRARQYVLELLQSSWNGTGPMARTSACIFLEHPERIPGTCYCTIRKGST